MTDQVVELWLDDARIGCGYRRFVVLEIGRKWVRLFHAPSLLGHTMLKGEFERAKRPAPGSKPSRIAKIIRRNVAQAKRLGTADGGQRAKQALSVLR